MANHTPDPAIAQRSLRITEIYASIQGESTWAGAPCVFIRLTRCPLRCVWCDTAYSFHGGENRSIAEIVAEASGFGIGLVEITGGEPLAQEECPLLARALLDSGHTVLVETSGALPIAALPRETIKIMDLKCPGSGECARNHWPNLDALDPARDEVKFVIASRQDYEWARDAIRTRGIAHRCHAVLLSPAFGLIAPRDIVAWMLEDHLPARFQLQMHKFIWPPDQKGV